MMEVQRYQVNLAYDGTPFAGWQVQPNASTVQGNLEAVISKIWHESIRLVGCGRTDSGVHASDYWAHFDSMKDCPLQFVKKVNANLPPQITVLQIKPIHRQWHARFDATSRTYHYFICKRKDPLNPFAFRFHGFDHLDYDKLHAAADLLKQYQHFKPFCKTRSDVEHYQCQIQQVRWHVGRERLSFEIRANRFLRGMVRLVVGMCLDVALGRMTLDQVKVSLNEQSPLARAWSVPAHGLFLSAVTYPD